MFLYFFNRVSKNITIVEDNHLISNNELNINIIKDKNRINAKQYYFYCII